MEQRQRKALAAGDLEEAVTDAEVAEEYYPEAASLPPTEEQPVFDPEPFLLERRREIETLGSSIPDLLLQFGRCESAEELKAAYEAWWGERHRELTMRETIAEAARTRGAVPQGPGGGSIPEGADETEQEENHAEEPDLSGLALPEAEEVSPPPKREEPAPFPGELETQQVNRCANCGTPLMPFQAADSRNQTGRPLCMSCLKKWCAHQGAGRRG